MDTLKDTLEEAKSFLDVAVSFNRLGRPATTQMQYLKAAQSSLEQAHKLLLVAVAKEKEL